MPKTFSNASLMGSPTQRARDCVYRDWRSPSLKIVNVEPAGSSAGDTVTITVRGQHFDPARDRDKVLFTGGGVAAERASIQIEPLPNNEQRIICRVPGAVPDVPLSLRTNPVLTVIGAGRRGEAV